MPDNREYQNNADSISSNVSAENQSLDEGMRRLKLEDSIEEVDTCSNPYPCRPGEPDCIYFLRTGSCGYGRNCRYNHPNYAAQATREKGELPERGGQPDCQHFLKTGLCKYGTTCKYNHPHEKLKQQAVSLNVLGFPMRQDEKSCPFYMRTGTCKYGVDCKFNHPQPSTMGTVYPISDASTYGSTGTPVVAMSNGPAVGGSTWPLSMGVPYISTSDMQNLQAYMPIILSPTLGNMPLQQGWTTYTGSMSLIPSAGVLETTYPPKSKNNPFPSASRIEKLPRVRTNPNANISCELEGVNMDQHASIITQERGILQSQQFLVPLASL
ncbi:hypothetical protein HPP92_003057 [Vanilla planifolia]|uniref:C3H1-type domain-containing protein n=1 Tax=Vanilla planifolia TaxID=51239 RepID=A0A835RU54_VANPL|nr:hypothetical protein HPP92_003057 [Vanilla planifolia]